MKKTLISLAVSVALVSVQSTALAQCADIKSYDQALKAAEAAETTRNEPVKTGLEPLFKTRLSAMTCFDKILSIDFSALANIGLPSLSGILTSAAKAIVAGLVKALIDAACNVFNQAWNASTAELNKMADLGTINVGGANVSANLLNISNSGTITGPTVGASAAGFGSYTIVGTNPGYSAGPGTGAQQPRQAGIPGVQPNYGGSSTASGGVVQSLKNLFR